MSVLLYRVRTRSESDEWYMYKRKRRWLIITFTAIKTITNYLDLMENCKGKMRKIYVTIYYK